MYNFDNFITFQLVMEYLYSGSGACLTQATAPRDLLELMAAASFFQLGPLLRYTEARCSALLDTENVVAMYIHSKVSTVTVTVTGLLLYRR